MPVTPTLKDDSSSIRASPDIQKPNHTPHNGKILFDSEKITDIPSPSRRRPGFLPTSPKLRNGFPNQKKSNSITHTAQTMAAAVASKQPYNDLTR